MSENEIEPTLHTPDDMAYSCHNEGVCCHVFDTIPLDEAASQAFGNLDPEALNTGAGNPVNFPIVVPNAAGPPSEKISRKPCGDCAMLTDEKLCAIHKIGGEAAKPRACQDFPWRYVETPDGIYVGLSFVCPSVRGNRGQLVSEQATGLKQKYRKAASVRAAQEIVPLNGRINLSWQDYKEIESALLDLLALPNQSLSIRLIAFCILPGFVDQMLTQSAALLESSGSAGSSSPVKEIIAVMRRNKYEHLLRVAQKPTRHSARSRRMFMGMFTSFANTLHKRGKGRLVTVAAVMGQYLRHAAGIGKIQIEPVEGRLSHVQLDEATVPDNGYAADQITRYISHCVWRKDLTLAGDLTRRIRLLALNAALIPWYAAALAAADKSEFPDDHHWDEAIGEVERLYGFHSAFYRFFEQNKAFSDIVDSFLLKPGYPFVLFR